MRRFLLLFLLIAPQSQVNSKINVDALIGGDSFSLGAESPAYGDIIGLLSTCSRYGKVVLDSSGESLIKLYDNEASRIGLEKLKQKDHIKISFGDQEVRLPSQEKSIFIEEIYVGFSKQGYPTIYTYGEGLTYSYSKCSGRLITDHFQCNSDLRKMFKIKPQSGSCKNH